MLSEDDIPEPSDPPEPLDPELERLLAWFITKNRKIAWVNHCDEISIAFKGKKVIDKNGDEKEVPPYKLVLIKE